MNASQVELIAIGEEVLSGHTISSNTTEIALMLEELGMQPHHHTAIGDRPQDISREIKAALSRSNVIIITGGLGPTSDDITRPVIAQALGLQLVRDDDIIKDIEERFASRGQAMPQSNLSQAEVPRGGYALLNPLGTAPGIYIPIGNKHIFLLPGVPAEMRVIMCESVLPKLKELFPHQEPLYIRKLRIVGLPESRLADLLSDAGLSPQISIAYLPQENEIFLLFKGEKELVDNAAKATYGILGSYIYAEGEEDMPRRVGQLLRERQFTLATAESCTGGLLGKIITDVPGSSDYYLGGAVVYSNHAKSILTNLDARLIEDSGAVSAPVAKALAEGIKKKLGSDLALGITGIAGPGGGSGQKPIGLVFTALATPRETMIRRWQFIGNRKHIRSRTACWALDLVRRWITDQWEQL